MIYLPLTNDPAAKTGIALGAESYLFSTYFMVSGVWLMDIMDSAGVAILSGIPLVPGCNNLLQGHGDLFKDVRMMVVSDTASANDTIDSLGNAAQVVWYTSSEQSPLVYSDPLLSDY